MSSDTATLLFELGMEELPPGALDDLSDRLATAVAGGLERAGVEYATCRAFGAPRRLAVQIEAVARRQPDRDFERRGPALAVAYDDNGAPTRAAEGFARSCGVDVEQLQTLETDEGTWLAHRGTESGRDTRELMPGIIEHALGHLPIPKRMRWGDQTSEFVRPVHWVVLMLDEAVVPVTVFGVDSGRESRGHRFHHPAPVVLAHAHDYTVAMRDAHVLVDRTDRRDHILEGVRAEGERIGGHAVIDPALLNEVNALVEWPVVLSGSFDEAFLRVPPEALISSMEGHQRYFPVRDADGRLLPRFITVANIDSRDPARVVAGNERVIRPRLADAAFFWDQDRARTLESRLPALEQVVFQKQLGSLADKSARVADLAARYAERFETDPGQARRAGRLAKADLVTEMVDEFPELQGVMGRYYATEDGEAPAVALALDEIYQPRFAADAIAASPLGRLLAVAERADTLTGIFAIGKAPTGAKDPFALRRAAVGLLRSLIEGEHPIDLTALLEDAAAHQPAGLNAGRQVQPLVEFCLERLRGLYHEAGYGAELFEAVRSVHAPDALEPLDFDRRLRACHDFARLSAAGSLASANKRIRNILRKADRTPPTHIDTDRLVEPAEQALNAAMAARAPAVETLIAQSGYSEALAKLAELREPIDRFFDGVMVMTDDAAIQMNRLALLQRLQQLFLAIADVSALPESS